MNRRVAVALGSMLVLVVWTTAFGAEQTWVGEISDSACGAKHESATENQPVPPPKQCTLDCVRGGSKFVLVSGGKVYPIANQNHADLAPHAGETVRLTGELTAGAIVVSAIEATKN